MSGRIENGIGWISGGLFNLQKIVLLILVSVITVINIAQITGRYVFHFSLPWSEQVSVLLFIIIIMLGASISVRTDTEIRIAFFQFKNPVIQLIFSILTDIISLITIGFFVYSSVEFFQHSLKFNQLISSIQVSYSYVFIFLPIGFSLIGIEKVFNIIRKIFIIKKYLN
jgi:TRAP-type C4-dicarboxylate transport system permease small subunit